MKEERILNVLSQVDEQFIVEAAPAKQKPRKPIWIKWAAAAACLCLIACAFWIPRLVLNPAMTEPEPETIPGIGGTSSTCIHTITIDGNIVLDDSYHQIAGRLINYIGQSRFNEWLNNNDGENLNIVNFVNENNIPKEFMEEIISTDPSVYYYFDYNIEAIYSGHGEEYYESDRVEQVIIRNYLLAFKSQLNDYIKTEKDYNNWLVYKQNSNWKYNPYCKEFDGNIRQWSILDVLSYFHISQEKIDEIDEFASRTVLYSCRLDIDQLHNNTYQEESDPAILDIELVSFDMEKLYEMVSGIYQDSEIIP